LKTHTGLRTPLRTFVEERIILHFALMWAMMDSIDVSNALMPSCYVTQ